MKNPNVVPLPRAFKWLNSTQFFGALNDNMFQLFLIFALSMGASKEEEAAIIAMAGVMFVLPFLIFAAPAGWVVDRFCKKSIIVTAKVWEVGTMSLGLYFFCTANYQPLFWVLFIMCMQSAFFWSGQIRHHS